MLDIKLPFLTWDGTSLEAIYKMLQSTPELGFLYKASIRDHVRENQNRGTLWAAYLDEQLVGVATIGSRRQYSHMARHGEIGVGKEFRRRRVATALYLAQMLQLILEGRRETEDTIIPALSPWMAGPTECGGDGVGFLPSLNYTRYGTLPSRTSAFKDIQLWGHKTYELDDYLSRISKDTEIYLIDTPKTRETFDKNLEKYMKHDEPLYHRMAELRQWVFDNFPVHTTAENDNGGFKLL